jgi:hypothetical protein
MINFSEAAGRHWEDAFLLEASRRLANADQLYGFAAECALKAIMMILGATSTAEGDLAEPRHRKHIDELWSEYQLFASGRRGARYLSPLAGFGQNPFADWNARQRYFADTALPSGAALAQHSKACRACLTALQRAEQDTGR